MSKETEESEGDRTRTKGQWFKFEISVGTILQLATMLALAAAAYAKFDARLAANELAIITQRSELSQQGSVLAKVVNDQTRLMTILEERRGKL